MTTKISQLPANQQIAWVGVADVTVSTALLNITQKWNAGAVAFTGLFANFTDTASASGSLLADLQVGGVSQFSVRKDGRVLANGRINASAGLAYLETGAVSLATDLFLVRDAANVLAQRNGTNAQTFNVYNTYTDASNYERGVIGWLSNVYRMGTANAGTGTYRSTEIVGNGITFTSKSDGSTTWSMNGNGHILANADNLYDIGAVGASRPRNGYFGTSVKTSNLEFTGSTILQGAGDGVFKPTKNAGGQLTVATLPAAATAGAGARAFVTDANASTFASVVAAGGANGVPVYSDGANWRIG